MDILDDWKNYSRDQPKLNVPTNVIWEEGLDTF